MKKKHLHEKAPEPMTLLHKREHMVDDLFSLPYRKPEVTPGKVDAAASAMAAWDNSDPFAYGRTALYVKQGYLDPEEVIHDMHLRTVARHAARIREVDDAKRAS